MSSHCFARMFVISAHDCGRLRKQGMYQSDPGRLRTALLIQYVLTSNDFHIQDAALQQLNAPAALRDLAMQENLDLEIRKRAVDRIKSSSTLREISEASTHADVAGAALERISTLLHDPDPHYRAEAVRQTDDQKLVVRLATEDQNEEVRIAAVQKVAEQSILARIAIEDTSPHVASAARAQLTDTDAILAYYARESNEFWRADVVRQLRDQDELKRIAETETSFKVAGAAWQGIEDQAYLESQLAKLLATRAVPNLTTGYFKPFFQAIEDRDVLIRYAREGAPNSRGFASTKADQHVRDHAANRLLELDNGNQSYYAPQVLAGRLVELKLLLLDPAIAETHGYVQLKVTHSSSHTDYFFREGGPPGLAGVLTAVSYDITLLDEGRRQILHKRYATGAKQTESFRLGSGSKAKISLFEMDELCLEIAATLDRRALALAHDSAQPCLRDFAARN